MNNNAPSQSPCSSSLGLPERRNPSLRALVSGDDLEPTRLEPVADSLPATRAFLPRWRGLEECAFVSIYWLRKIAITVLTYLRLEPSD